MTPMVLTLIGDDKPGLVNAASAAVAAHGGSWVMDGDPNLPPAAR